MVRIKPADMEGRWEKLREDKLEMMYSQKFE